MQFILRLYICICIGHNGVFEFEFILQTLYLILMAPGTYPQYISEN